MFSADWFVSECAWNQPCIRQLRPTFWSFLIRCPYRKDLAVALVTRKFSNKQNVNNFTREKMTTNAKCVLSAWFHSLQWPAVVDTIDLFPKSNVNSSRSLPIQSKSHSKMNSFRCFNVVVAAVSVWYCFLCKCFSSLAHKHTTLAHIRNAATATGSFRFEAGEKNYR